MEELLQGPVQLTEQIRKAVEQADSFRQECENLQKQVDKIAQLLRTAARYSTSGSGGLYERPTRRIMTEVEKALEKALALVKKCKRSGVLKRVITITSATDFRRVNIGIESSIGDLKWLLNVSASGDDRSDYGGLPPVVATDPILALIWEQVARVQSGTADQRADGAADLATLARDNERNGKIIIEEGGLPPLLKLLREGTGTGQENAARALGALASDEQRVLEMVRQGAIPVFLHILANGPMTAQINVAWAIAQMASHSVDAQNGFASNGAIRLLVAHLVHDLDEPSKTSSKVSIHTVVASSLAKKGTGKDDKKLAGPKPTGQDGWSEDDTRTATDGVTKQSGPDGYRRSPEKANIPLKPTGYTVANTRGGLSKPGSGPNHPSSIGENGKMRRKERENEDPELKAHLNAEAAHALWKLAEKNIKNSKSITDTRALLCFAQLIEQGQDGVQRNCVMAVMEIAMAAEQDPELKRAAFKTNSPAAKAVVQQLLRLVEEGEADLQVACLKSIGCLARIFPAATTVIKPLASQLSSREPVVAAAAAAALVKFVESENYLRVEHARSIVGSSVVPPVVQMVYFGEGEAQLHALKLLCYLAIHVGDSELLGDALPALGEASRNSSFKLQEPSVRALMADAIQRLEIYQAGSRKHDLHSYQNAYD